MVVPAVCKEQLHPRRAPNHEARRTLNREDFPYDDDPMPGLLADERNLDFPLDKAGEGLPLGLLKKGYSGYHSGYFAFLLVVGVVVGVAVLAVVLGPYRLWPTSMKLSFRTLSSFYKTGMS